MAWRGVGGVKRTSCWRNERLDTLLSMGLRQIHIATYISRLSRGTMRRCRGGVGSRAVTAPRDAFDRPRRDDLFNYRPKSIGISPLLAAEIARPARVNAS